MKKFALSARRTAAALVIATVAAAGAFGQSALAQAEPTNGSWQYLKSHVSGKCVDVEYQSLSDGARAHQWTCGPHQSQMWTLVPTGDGYHYIVARHSGMYLDLYWGRLDDGTKIQQTTCHGGDMQIWRPYNV